MAKSVEGPTPLDIAEQILFAHPSLQALDVDAAQRVKAAIAGAPGINDLATTISRQGPATEKGGWATIETVGQVQEKAARAFQLSQETVAATVAPLAAAIAATQNEAGLEDRLWFVIPATAGGYYPVKTDTGFDWTIAALEPVYGMAATRVSAAVEAGRWSVDLVNYAPAFRGLSVEFLDTRGRPITPTTWQSRLPAGVDSRFETTTRKWLTLLSPSRAISGVVLPATTETVSFQTPQDVHRIRLIFGGLGRDRWDAAADGLGAGVSAVMGYALAGILLKAGVDSPPTVYTTLLGRADLVQEVMAASGFLLDAADADAAYADLVRQLGPLIYGGGLPKLMDALLEYTDAGRLAGAAQVVSWAAAGLGASNGRDGQFAGDPLSAPGTFTMTLFREMIGTISAVVQADPAVGAFPPAAKKVTVDAEYAGQRREQSAAVPGIATGEPELVFDAVPANRAVAFCAAVTGVDGGVLARASAYSPAGHAARPGTRLMLEDEPVVFDAATRYEFAATLAYSEEQGHHWATGPAPLATIKDLNGGATGHNLAALIDVSLDAAGEFIGYAWQASGQHLPLCGTSQPTDGQIHAFQTVSRRSRPERGLQFPGCGFSAQPFLTFAPPGTEGGFYLDPRNGNHLRGFVPGQPFDPDRTTSWGRFLTPHLDDLLIHPAGYAVGVSFGDNTLNSVYLRQGPDAQAPVAGAAGGAGTREGRFSGPLALALTPDGTLLVLEAGNRRLQAVDVHGNPVPYFPNDQALLPLDGDATYLDVATDPGGHILLLFYLGDGGRPADYCLEIRTPDGAPLSRSTGLPGARIAVDSRRNVFSLGYGKFSGPGSRTEPSLNLWVPTPSP